MDGSSNVFLRCSSECASSCRSSTSSTVGHRKCQAWQSIAFICLATSRGRCGLSVQTGCTCTHLQSHTHSCRWHTSIHMHRYKYIRTFTYTNIHANIHKYVCTHPHTHVSMIIPISSSVRFLQSGLEDFARETRNRSSGRDACGLPCAFLRFCGV